MSTTTTKTVLVTGATSGIGRHAALELARLGHRVFATGRREDALASLQDEARAAGLGDRLTTLRLDVTDARSIDEAREEVHRATSGRGLDVLVNNAGYGQMGPVDSVDDQRVRAQFETNVFGLLSVTRAFVPAMRRRGSGLVVNVGSSGGRMTFPFMGVYSATKYAVESLSDALRQELAPFGVHVSLIEPGYIRTNFTGTSMADLGATMAGSPYASQLAKADAVLAKFEATAAGPEVVTRAIVRAMTSSRPKARYNVPFTAWFTVQLFSFLPSRLTDWAVARAMGLGRMVDAGGAVAAA